jgi:hypothetical protein
MGATTSERLRRRTHLGVDADGQLTEWPRWLLPVWIVLIALVAVEAINELGWIGRPSSFYEIWIHDAVILAAAGLVFLRAALEPVARHAWVCFGVAMALWGIGTIGWDVLYGGQANPPYPTFADVLWLLWYPFMIAGMVILVRVRFKNFELLRWMDGIVVILLVLVAGFGLVVQPLANETTHSWVASSVDFAYPVLDVVLIGALLGIYGLLGWRPDAIWIFIGLGVLASTCADAAFAVQQARGVPENGYDFVWTLGALLIAYAAWVHSPHVHDDDRQVTGMRAIALALIAQAVAIAIQITAIFKEIGKSERIVTALVLVIASIQLIMSRPRDEAPAQEPGSRHPSEQEDGADHAGHGRSHGLL